MRNRFPDLILLLAGAATLSACDPAPAGSADAKINSTPTPTATAPAGSAPITVRADQSPTESASWAADIVAMLKAIPYGYTVKEPAITFPKGVTAPSVGEVWYNDAYVDQAQSVCQDLRKKYKGSIIRRIGGKGLDPMMYVHLPKGNPPGPQTSAPPPLCAEGPEAPDL